MEQPCKTEDDCPTPMWCRDKSRCPKRDATEQPKAGSDQRLVRRFHRSRWSRTRRRMDAMEPGDVLTLPLSEYYNAHSSAMRLSDAYPDRQWKTSRRRQALTVFCDATNVQGDSQTPAE